MAPSFRKYYLGSAQKHYHICSSCFPLHSSNMFTFLQGIWQDSLAVPTYTTAASILVLSIHVIFTSDAIRPEQPWIADHGVITKFRKHMTELGGPTAVSFKMLRLLSSLTLVVLSALSIVSIDYPQGQNDVARLHIALFITYVYFTTF